MKSEKLWNLRFVQLLAIETLFYFGAYLTNPIVSGYAILLGASVALAGLIAGLSAIMALAPRPFMGMVGDRFSKKYLLAIAAIFFMIATFGCAVSSSPTALVVFRSIQGIAFAFRSVSVIALVSLVVPHDRIGQAVGITGLAQTVACAIGPMIASSLVARMGYAGSFVLAGALFVIALCIILLFKAPAEAAGTKVRKGAQGDSPSRGLRLSDFLYLPAVPITVVACLVMAPHGSAISLLFLAADGRGIDGAPLYFVVYSIIAFVARPLVGRATDKFPLRRVIVPVLLIEIAATLFLAFMDSLWWVMAGGFCMGLGQATAYSALQAEAVRHADPSELGRASNTFYIGPDLGMGFGPALAGSVMQVFGSTAMFLVLGCLVFAGLCVFLMFDGNARKSSAVPQTKEGAVR